MSTPNQPVDAGAGNYQVLLGGTLAGNPQPPELFYPLRCDQFLTMRDGEMSEARSVRDACITAFVAASVGIGGLVSVINWEAPIMQQKVAVSTTFVLCVGALAALVVGWVQHRSIKRTRGRSAYSRLACTIEGHFQITETAPESRWRRLLKFLHLS